MISNEELAHHVWFRDKIIPWMRARNIHVPAAATPDELLEEIGNKLEEHRQFLEDFLRRGT